MGCILETALPFFNERRALTDFHCVMYHIHPEEWKSHFAHIRVWLFITKATYEEKPCDEVLLELISSLHGEWQLCWGWAWLAAVPQCCVPRILSPCNSCSSHRQRDGVRTEETRRGCCNPWRERTRETDTLIVYVVVQRPQQVLKA